MVCRAWEPAQCKQLDYVVCSSSIGSLTCLLGGSLIASPQVWCGHLQTTHFAAGRPHVKSSRATALRHALRYHLSKSPCSWLSSNLPAQHCAPDRQSLNLSAHPLNIVQHVSAPRKQAPVTLLCGTHVPAVQLHTSPKAACLSAGLAPTRHAAAAPCQAQTLGICTPKPPHAAPCRPTDRTQRHLVPLHLAPTPLTPHAPYMSHGSTPPPLRSLFGGSSFPCPFPLPFPLHTCRAVYPRSRVSACR